MRVALHLDDRSPRTLPPGTTPWRVRSGSVEVYLVTPARRRFVAVAGSGACIAPLPATDAMAYSLVASEPTVIEPDAGGDVGSWIALARRTAGLGERDDATDSAMLVAALDRHFAAIDQDRDLARASRLYANGRPAPGAPNLARAIAEAAAAFGCAVGRLPMGAAFDQAPELARVAGFRAINVALPAAWWRNDHGPLLLRDEGGAAMVFVRWRGGDYRFADDTRLTAPKAMSLHMAAYRLYPPLGGDISRFATMVRTLLPEFRAEAPLLLGAGLGSAFLGLGVPILIGWVFGDVVPSGDGGLLITAGLALIAAALGTMIFAAVRGLAIGRIAGRSQVAMAAAVADHILRLPARFFRTIPAGDLDRRLAGLTMIRMRILDFALNAGLSLIFAASYLVLLCFYDAGLVAAGMGLMLVHIVVMLIGCARRAKPLREAAERQGRLSSLTFELIEALPKLRLAAAERAALDRWQSVYGAERRATAAGDHVAGHLAAFADAWPIMTMMALFAIGGWSASTRLSPGLFIAFLAGFAALQASLTAFVDAFMAIQALRPLADRIRPILMAMQEEGIGGADPGRLSGAISATNLVFGYGRTTAPLIDGLSFSVRPGEHLAIVGASGAGKSTILRLLLGFEHPSAGALCYDGQDVVGLDLTRVRAQIGVVLQSSQLFAGSILDNIRAASSASVERCREAAERAGLGADLQDMPMGLHTPLTEGAGTLSGGQRQRILIARALALDPAILFLDEATSALDNATQAIVARTLDELDATRITIAHRLSTVRNADRICVLDAGRFVEEGDFDTLMARNGAFAALARRQLLEAHRR